MRGARIAALAVIGIDLKIHLDIGKGA